jgi:hypothetical protein
MDLGSYVNISKLESLGQAVLTGSSDRMYAAAAELLKDSRDKLITAAKSNEVVQAAFDLADIDFSELAAPAIFELFIGTLEEVTGVNRPLAIESYSDAQKTTILDSFDVSENSVAEATAALLTVPLMIGSFEDINTPSGFLGASLATHMNTVDAPPTALVTMAEEMRTSSYGILKLFGDLVISRKSDHADFLEANMRLLMGTQASDYIAALSSADVKTMLVGSIHLVESFGITNGALTAFRAVLNNTNAITTVAFQTALGEFLDAIWPGLATEISLPLP